MAGGYVLLAAGLLIAAGLVFHPLPSGGFEERPSVLAATPWWGAIHVAIAFGQVFCAMSGLLLLVAGGSGKGWANRFFWAAVAIGMMFFASVGLINAWVMHYLAPLARRPDYAAVFDAFNKLLVGYGWLGNPLFLVGLTGIAWQEVRAGALGLPRWLAGTGLAFVLFSWLRGIGSATGLSFLEPFLVANIPAFLWLAYYGVHLAGVARGQEKGDIRAIAPAHTVAGRLQTD